MPTRVLCTFGCYVRPVASERMILAIADDFRRQLCQLYWERHRAIVDLRNARMPALYAALVEFEAAKSAIYEIETAIKAHHAEVRDRNAVTPEQQARLITERERRDSAKASIDSERKEWSAHLKAFAIWWRDQADWKNVKSLEARKKAYAALEVPSEFADYAALWMDFDLRERDLYREFAPYLHSSIRGEIVDASQPKLKKDAPGMRYFYHREPEPKPWEKLTLQFPGGVKWEDAVAGKCPSLKMKLPRGDWSRIQIDQQIGTKENPCVVQYEVRADRPIPLDTTIQRWTMAIRPDGKREVMPLLKDLNEPKPIGKGKLAYRLRWTVRKAGVEVCHFWGDHVNERLVIPAWTVELRMAVKVAQEICDRLANELLLSRGLKPAKRQGVAALEAYCDLHDDAAAANVLDDLQHRLHRAHITAKRAAGTIEKIYETVVRRVCSLHDTLVAAHDLDLRKLKRYDTRDLLKEDVVPKESREIMHAVAPGKLKALLEHWGLAASTEVPPAPTDDARDTDLFTSYVASIRGRYGSKRGGKGRRSQTVAQVAAG